MVPSRLRERRNGAIALSLFLALTAGFRRPPVRPPPASVCSSPSLGGISALEDSEIVRTRGTAGIPCSIRWFPMASAFADLLQKMMTLDFWSGGTVTLRLPFGIAAKASALATAAACAEASSAHTFFIRLTISAILFPPVQVKCSGAILGGSWCKLMLVRRVIVGSFSCRYAFSAGGIVALLKTRLTG